MIAFSWPPLIVSVLCILAVLCFFGWVFRGLVRWIISEWRKIEAEEEELRRQGFPALQKRGR
jgi:hypothetical protein